MRARRLAALTAAALATPLIVASPAPAATLTSSGGSVSYSAAAGEDNSLLVTRDGDNYVFTDAPAITITPTAPCFAGPTMNVGLCPVAGIESMGITLGNLDDDGSVAGSVTDAGRFRQVNFNGGVGSDSITGSPAAPNSLVGDDGAPAGDDILTGGELDDDIDGLGGADTLNGGDGDDSISPGAGNDTVNGGDGFDFFNAGSPGGPDGADTFAGGAQSDRLSLFSRRDDLRLDLNGVADDGAGCPGPGCEGDNVQPDVEEIFGGRGDDLIVGNAADNDLSGNDGADQVLGGSGDDNLVGADGDDVINGGPGPDEIFPGEGADRGFGEGGDDAFGEGYADFGADLIAGGPGTDSVGLQSGNRLPLRVSLDGRANDRVFSPLTTFPPDNVGPSVENITGGPLGDVLVGNRRANELVGGDGADRLAGLAGGDALIGGRGGDQLQPGKGSDTIDGAGGADRIRSHDGKGDHVLCGAAADRVRGDRRDRIAADCERVRR